MKIQAVRIKSIDFGRNNKKSYFCVNGDYKIGDRTYQNRSIKITEEQYNQLIRDELDLDFTNYAYIF